MYIIYQNNNKEWILRLRAKSLKIEHKFEKYIDALDAAQMLQLKTNKFDRVGRVLRKVG